MRRTAAAPVSSSAPRVAASTSVSARFSTVRSTVATSKTISAGVGSAGRSAQPAPAGPRAGPRLPDPRPLIASSQKREYRLYGSRPTLDQPCFTEFVPVARSISACSARKPICALTKISLKSPRVMTLSRCAEKPSWPLRQARQVLAKYALNAAFWPASFGCDQIVVCDGTQITGTMTWRFGDSILEDRASSLARRSLCGAFVHVPL
mmetsp:Transcript_23450/g.81322  ORF Transcript_23450/g.81322 Transcript_23450/m.81322 type:complete len:207 (+) Transcript_23450:1273-1893(+)